jgi:uncharacterized OsmC-like protein
VLRDGRVRLASVHARYTLPLAVEHEAAARRAFALHEAACPASRSVREAIPVTWEAELLPEPSPAARDAAPSQ